MHEVIFTNRFFPLQLTSQKNPKKKMGNTTSSYVEEEKKEEKNSESLSGGIARISLGEAAKKESTWFALAEKVQSIGGDDAAQIIILGLPRDEVEKLFQDFLQRVISKVASQPPDVQQRCLNQALKSIRYGLEHRRKYTGHMDPLPPESEEVKMKRDKEDEQIINEIVNSFSCPQLARV